jgi:DNA-binding transcriptional MerR regulator
VRTKWFEQLKNSRFHGVKELADAAEELLREMGSSQERGTVAEYPNERTVRYYLSENLLPEPLGKAGSASIFGYEHLVSLVAIKKLQSEGLPINVIKGVIEGRSIEELEGLLDGKDGGSTQGLPPAPARPSAVGEELEEIQFSSFAAPPPQSEPPTNAAKSFLESILFSRRSPQPADDFQLSRLEDREEVPSMASQPAFSESPEPVPNKWIRHEIEPGLELHVRDDYTPMAGWRKVIRTIEKILKMNKPGK